MAAAAPLLVAQVAFTAMAGAMQARQASAAAQASVNAATANNARVQSELERQAGETNRIFDEKRSDRQLQFDRDLASIRVAAAEGMSGMASRFTGEAAYLASTDFSRIEANREAEIAGVDSRAEASNIETQNTIAQANQSVKNARQNIFLGTIGSGIQIGANYQRDAAINEALKNRRTTTT